MHVRDEVRSFLQRWAKASEARDADAAADLFLRDPAPLVTFSDGHRVGDWLDVRIRLARDFGRAFIDRVEVHDIVAAELAPEVVAVTFVYDIHVRDMWGVENVATRLGSMSLLRTKDGFRIAQAHFSAPPAA